MLSIIISLSFLGASPAPAPTDIVWVFFQDKGTEVFETAAGHLPPAAPQAFARRVLNMGQLFDYDDRPVSSKYIDEIVRRGGILRYQSSWLNGASFRLPPALTKKIEALPFVKKVQPVAVYQQTIAKESERPANVNRSMSAVPGVSRQSADVSQWKDFYGSCYIQAAMMNVPKAYFSGYTGSGVTIGILDTGFKRKHSAVKNIRVVKEHDFITGDDLVLDTLTVLHNVVLTQDPLLYSDGKNTIHLFYSADTFSAGEYTRPLFWATAPLWQPVALSTPVLDNAAVNPTVTGRDTIFLAWQGFGITWDSRINFGYYDGSWKGLKTITAGSLPALTGSGDPLYLAYVAGDSSVALRTGTISGTGIDWSAEKIIVHAGEAVGSTQAVATTDRNIDIFWTGLSSGKIFLVSSADSGMTFSSPRLLDGSAGTIRAVMSGSTVHLVYKDYSHPGFVGLAYKNSTDWNKKRSVAGDSVLDMGDFSIAGNGDTLTVVFESGGQIVRVESNDNGQTWTKPGPVPGSPTEFAFEPRVQNDHIFWLRRGDDNTDYDSTQDNITQPNHGTRMLSVIGSYEPGQFMGIAPGADFIVAKTEKYMGLGSTDQYEFSVEEDAWIAGLEWLERSGADLVTSSLGYINWYSYQDMDGKTAPVSIAASLAAKRGLLVVNAIGNRSSPNLRPYLNAPGDAEGIITMGGTETDSLYKAGMRLTDSLWWTGSGFGPTADGRMKPELVAPADGVWAVDPDSDYSALVGAGTSFSTALMAGGCALIKEAHPNWSLDSLKAVLFKTASNYGHPSDTLGYGLPNIDSAVYWTPPQPPSFSSNSLLDPFPNPFVPARQTTVSIPFLILEPSTVELRIFTLDGVLVQTINPAKDINNPLFLPGRYESRDPNSRFAAAVWDGKNWAGKPVASGIYLVLLSTGYGGNVKKIVVVR